MELPAWYTSGTLNHWTGRLCSQWQNQSHQRSIKIEFIPICSIVCWRSLIFQCTQSDLQQRSEKTRISDINNCQTIIECLLKLRPLNAFCEMLNIEMLRLHKSFAMAKPKLKRNYDKRWSEKRWMWVMSLFTVYFGVDLFW